MWRLDRRSRSRGVAPVVGVAAYGMLATATAAPTGANELSHDLVAPSNCDNCHQFDNPLPQAAEPAFAPYDSWAGSMMANAARDPVFWAGVAIASQDAPGSTEICIQCHSPRGFLEGRGDSIELAQLQPDDRFSVECELCHRMVDEGNIGNGQYTVDDTQIMGNVPRRGPWTYAGADPPHSWQQDAYIGDAALCGVCHDVTTPTERVDDFGVGTGLPFNEQRTYSEWAGSDYAVPGPGFASCQDCHMPAVADVAGCANFLGGGEHPSGGRRHDNAGANVFVLELLKSSYGNAGTGEVSDAAYDHAIARTQEMLASAATLQVFAPAAVDLGVGFDLDVTVTNETGHKLPTGYAEGRVMWLEVVAWYAGQLLYSSGHWDAGQIEQDPQLRTYEGIAEQWSTGAAFHLLLNDHWVEDTRIPPAGLMPDVQTDPVTTRYPLLPGGAWAHWDDVSYTFDPILGLPDATPADPNDDELEITVRLRYLINTPDYVVFLETENVTNAAGLDLAGAVAGAGDAPALILAEEVVVVDLGGFDAMPMGTTSGGMTTGGMTTGGATTDGTTMGSTRGETTMAATSGDGSTSAGESTGSSTGGGDATGASTSAGTTDASSSGASTGGGVVTGGEGSGATTTGAVGDATTGAPTTVGTGDGSGTAGSEGATGVDDAGCRCRSVPSDGHRLALWSLLLPTLRRRRRRDARAMR